MSNRSETFGRLLKVAINSIATSEGKTAPIVEEELAEKVGLAGSAIQRYKSGYLPPEPRTIEIIAEAAVRRGLFSREWLQRFLHAARYHQADKLLDQLCPIGPARPRPPRIYQNLPAPTYSQFVARKEASAEVLEGLSKRSAAVIIVGLGGNGKTSLAREIADYCLKGEHGQAMFDAAVWVSDKDRPGTTNLSVVLDEIARTLDYPGFTQFEHDEKRREVEQLLRRQRVLVCIDNFETITDGALLSWLLNLPEPSKAMITTREYRREYRRGGWPVELRGMSDAEARALVDERLKVLRIEKLMSDQAQLDPLIAATGGNPKAIELTLGLVKYERRPLQQVVDDLYAARGELFSDLLSRAWSLLDEASRRILLIMTFFPASASSESLSATADVHKFAFDRAVERLTDLALIDIQQPDLNVHPRYTLHPLVRAFSEARISEHKSFELGARERWMEWYVNLATSVGECWNDLSKLELLESEHETLYAVVTWAFANERYRETISLVRGGGYFFYVRGFWDKTPTLDLVHAYAARHLSDPIEELDVLANLVQILSRQGILSEVEQYIPRMEAIACSVEIPANVNYEYQHALELYWAARNNLDMAINALRSSLLNHHQLSPYFFIANQQWLATRLTQADRQTEAKTLFQTALNSAIQHGYERGIIACQIGLASIELKEGFLDNAEQLITDSVARATRNRDKRYLAEAKRAYAQFHVLMGNRETAYLTLTEAVDLFERMGLRRDLAEAREELRRLDDLGEAPAA